MAWPVAAAVLRTSVASAALRQTGRLRACCLWGCMLAVGCAGVAGLVSLATLTAVVAVVGNGESDGVAACVTGCGSLAEPMRCPGLTVSQGFGDTPWEHPHTGIDIVCPPGTPVVALSAGTAHVLNGGSAPCLFPAGKRGGFGDFVAVSYGSIVVVYGHLSGFAVLDGTQVMPGTPLGWEGDTGCATGPHLHLEVDVGGKPVDPCSYLPAGYPAAHDPAGLRCWGAAPP